MSDEDMIRRGDAIEALTRIALHFGITGEPLIMILAKNAIRDIPAVPVGVTSEEAALEEQIEKLRNLCDCDCDDEDCVKCAHYPAILEQKKDELARIRSALTVQPSPDLAALVEAARNLSMWCRVNHYSRHQDETLGALLKSVDAALARLKGGVA